MGGFEFVFSNFNSINFFFQLTYRFQISFFFIKKSIIAPAESEVTTAAVPIATPKKQTTQSNELSVDIPEAKNWLIKYLKEMKSCVDNKSKSVSLK